jgi:hypothetical protein
MLVSLPMLVVRWSQDTERFGTEASRTLKSECICFEGMGSKPQPRRCTDVEAYA